MSALAIVLILVIFVLASLSLISYVYCWHDVLSGRPHILSMRQVTSVMDRHVLDAMFGRHEPGYYYKLSPAQKKALVAVRWKYVLRECAADSTCVYGAWLYFTHSAYAATLPWFILLAGACQGISVLWSLQQIRKWKDQIREEIDNQH